MNVLVIDVGGHHVKILATGESEKREFESSSDLTAEEMVDGVKKLAEGWSYEAISLGYPGPVLRGHPVAEPVNLGKGWVGFDYEKAFGVPIKLINDAAMQAVGSYQGGRMLFLGLGTGLGSAMIVEGVVEPLELAHLPYRKGTFEDYVGIHGLDRLGKKHWRRRVADVVKVFEAALQPTDVVIGGGNVKKLKDLPPGTRAGDNANAFTGGFRLWDDGCGIQTGAIPVHGAEKNEASTPASEADEPDSDAPHDGDSGTPADAALDSQVLSEAPGYRS